MEDQLKSLIEENEALKKQIEELKDENSSLWFMLEEQKNSDKSIGQAVQSMLREVLEEEYVKSLKPVGDA
tara:strand:+ start:616 stop:825 length:210 start_codon:yes stop_codon:yes gene_type:complete